MDLESDIFQKIFIPKYLRKYLRKYLKKNIYYRLESVTKGLDDDTKFGGHLLIKNNIIKAKSRKTGYLNIIDRNKNNVGSIYLSSDYTCLKGI